MKLNTLYNSSYFAENSYKRQMLDQFTNTGVTTLLVKTILAPIQRYKIIKQTQIANPLRPNKFKSFMQYVQRIPKEQGYLSFWRSNGTNFWIYFTQLFLQFGIYDNLKFQCKILQEQYQIQSDFLKGFIQKICLPFVTSFIAHVFTYPLDTVRVRLAMSHHSNKSQAYFTSVRTCFGDIKTNQRFRSVYRGFWLSNLIACSHFNLFLQTNKLFSNLQLNSDGLGAQSNLNLSAWLSSIIMTAIFHPLDTVRRIIQLNNLSRPALFTNARSVIAYLRQNHYLLNTYNGFTAAIFKTILVAPFFTLVSKARQEVDFSSLKSKQTEKVQQNQSTIKK